MRRAKNPKLSNKDKDILQQRFPDLDLDNRKGQFGVRPMRGKERREWAMKRKEERLNRIRGDDDG